MNSKRSICAFSLVEVTIALGIAAFCLLSTFGLLSVGVNTSKTSIEQTTASNVLGAISSDLRSTPPSIPKGANGATSPLYQISIPAAQPITATVTPGATQIIYLDSNGRINRDASGAVLTSAGDSTYRLSVQITPGLGRGAAVARLVLSWPAGAPVSLSASQNSTTQPLNPDCVEAVIALDRN